ncbi:MAG: methionyl-tRNA formyltransferase [Patescibacteria group bacterium]|nr:methionyl-tRNA formyltransferase [Patescibacteria group bacterium]
MNQPLHIIYFGTADFAVAPLERLVSDPRRFEVVAVVSQPDKPAGRSAAPQKSPIALAADQRHLTLMQPERLRGNDEFRSAITALNSDFIIVAAYGKILPPELLAIAKHGTLNLHGSLLPKYRGASPIQAAILAGETETGVSLMLMDAELDHGPVYAEARLSIGGADSYGSLATRLSHAAADLLADHLEKIAEGQLAPQEQDHDAATYTRIIAKEDGRADWEHATAVELERRLRAYAPWPGLFTFWTRNGRVLRLKIIAAQTVTDSVGHRVGEVFSTPDGSPAVAAAEGALALTELQIEGKAAQNGREFLRGYKDFVGSVLESPNAE